MLTRTRAKKAFTLLELIVVLVILGLLAALAIPTFARVIERSRDARTLTSLKAVARNAQAIAAINSRDAVQASDITDSLGETNAASGVLAASLTGSADWSQLSTVRAYFKIDATNVLALESRTGRVCVIGFARTAVSAGTCAPTSGVSNNGAELGSDPAVAVAAPGGSGGSTPTTTPASTVYAASLADSPVSFYPLNDANGTVVTDISGGGRNGTANADRVTFGVSSHRSDIKGASMVTTAGNATTITLPSAAVPSSGPFSMEAWVRTTANGSRFIGGHGNAENGWRLYIDASDKLHLVKSNSGDYSSGLTVPVATWSYIALVYAADGTATLYVNSSSATIATSATLTDPSSVPGGIGSFGDTKYASSFEGSMAGVGFYNKLLTPTQVGNHYNGSR